MTPGPALARVEAIFRQVAARPSAERPALLSELCAGDPPLLAAVERLLRFHEAPEGVLDRPAIGGVSALASDDLQGGAESDAELFADGTELGGYRITGKLGQGGMGVVYTARQQRPNRDVALKVIRPDITGRAMLRRFEQEADLLARLQHPGIAQVYEAGIFNTPAGERAFIAMELIDGLPLDRICADRGVGLREKLLLLAEICEAVDHAHQRGIIHRDLKSANILVITQATRSGAMGDGRSSAKALCPKVLDFGIARAVERPADSTMVTQEGQIIGTPAYMSPEQFSGSIDGIDVRSDVYTLGVLAFEMLTGRLPHDPGTLSVIELARVIREEEPPLLGTLDRSLRGDIETIVSRALAKEKHRRYQSAGAMAADVRRHLSSEPIDAKRDSTLYVIGRRFKRNPRTSLALSILTTIIAVGIVVLAMVSLQKNRALAHAARTADESKAAQTQTAQLATMLKDTLRNVRSLAVPGKDATAVREFMEQSRREIDRARIAEPKVEAELRTLMGDIYFCLRMLPEATEQHEKGVGLITRDIDRRSPAYSHALSRLASDRREQDNLPEARSLFDRALAALETQEHPDPVHSAEVRLKAAEIRWVMGEFAEAERLARGTPEAVETAPNAIALRVSAFGTYAQMLASLGRTTEAIDYFRKGVAAMRAVGHEIRRVLAGTLNRLAVCQLESGDALGAEPSLRESIEIGVSARGEDSPVVAIPRINLACVYAAQNRREEAAALISLAAPKVRPTEEGELSLAAVDLLAEWPARLRAQDNPEQARVVEECVAGLRARAARPSAK